MHAPCPACRQNCLSMERNCTVLLHYDKNTPPNEDEIREELEHKEVDKKVSGLKTLISLTLNGEVMPKLLMTVIRFCVPCDNHQIKKLLLIYWEVIDKTGPDGKLLPEMILVWCAPPPPPPPICLPACPRPPARHGAAPVALSGRAGTAGEPGAARSSSAREAARQAGLAGEWQAAAAHSCARACCGSNNLRNDLSHANEYIRGDDASSHALAGLDPWC